MLLIAAALALLVIYTGMKLMAHTKKDGLGNMFKYVSWFIVIMGFLILLCVGAHSLRRCCFMHGHTMMMRTEMMGNGNKCIGGMSSCHDGMMMGNGGGGCNMHSGCCSGSMEGCCGEMKSGCDEGMNSCKGDMKENGCGMDGKMKVCTTEKKDTVVIIKKNK